MIYIRSRVFNETLSSTGMCLTPPEGIANVHIQEVTKNDDEVAT